MEQNSVLVSIIIPCYNTEKYIEDCLDSILAAELPSYEVICVDDGSTDNTAAIIKRYAEQHPQIQYVWQENAGVSVARNTGMEIAKGQYTLFADSDDFYYPNAIKYLLNEAAAVDAETVVFQRTSAAEEDHFNREITMPCYDLVRVSKEDPKSSSAVWSVIYQTEFLRKNNIRFVPNMKYGEDFLFNFTVLFMAQPERQYYSDTQAYAYRQRATSAMNSKNHADVHADGMIQMIDYYREFQKKGSELSDVQKKALSDRIILGAGATVVDTLKMNKADGDKYMAALKERGCYPYPFLPYMITRKFCVGNILVVLCRHPWFYRLMRAILKK